MNKSMKKQLETVVDAIINEDTKKASVAFHSYLNEKMKMLLAEQNKYGSGLHILNSDNEVRVITDLDPNMSQEEFDELCQQECGDAYESMGSYKVLPPDTDISQYDELDRPYTFNQFIDDCISSHADNALAKQDEYKYGRIGDPDHSGPMSDKWVGH